MARVQLLMSDEDRTRFVYQAHQEGMSLSAWLRAAARERLERQSRIRPFESVAEVETFFAQCDKLEPAGTEPDWDQHLAVMNEARKRGATST